MLRSVSCKFSFIKLCLQISREIVAEFITLSAICGGCSLLQILQALCLLKVFCFVLFFAIAERISQKHSSLMLECSPISEVSQKGSAGEEQLLSFLPYECIPGCSIETCAVNVDGKALQFFVPLRIILYLENERCNHLFSPLWTICACACLRCKKKGEAERSTGYL